MLGYDWLKGSSSMTAAIAEGLAEGATRQRAPAAPSPAADPAPPVPKPEQKSGSFWTDPLIGTVSGWKVVAGAVGAVALVILIGKLR